MSDSILTYPRKKRIRAHRKAAKYLLGNGGFFNGNSAPGSTFHAIALWHRQQIRKLGKVQ